MKNELKLSETEYVALDDEKKKLYDFAVKHIDDDWAVGPYGGWSRAHDALKQIGYVEKVYTEGNRRYVSLVKPDALKKGEE